MAGGSFRLDRIRAEPGGVDEPEVASLSGFAESGAGGGATAELAELGGPAAPSAEAAVADLRTAGKGALPAAAVSATELAGAGEGAATGHGDRSATVADLARMIGGAGRSGGVGAPGDRRSRRRGTRRPDVDESADVRPGRPTGGGQTRPGARGPSRPAGDGAPEPEPEPAGEPQQEPGSRAARRQARADRAAAQAQAAIDADPVGVAREVCLRLLTDRARTRLELAQALRRRGIPDDAAHTVLSRFDEVGLIDDAAFAGQWVRSRHRYRGLARRAIAMELRRKGVDEEIVGEALAEVDIMAEEERAHELVVRKLRSMSIGSSEEQTVAARRLVGMLARKGYGSGVAYGVVRRALAERGADLDDSDHPYG